MADMAQRSSAGVAAALAVRATVPDTADAEASGEPTDRTLVKSGVLTIDVEPGSEAECFRDYATMFRFYGNALLYELTEEQIGILAESDFSIQSERPEEARGYEWMRGYLARRGVDARRDLAVDYARIFLAAGIFEGDTAVPYESVYLSEAKILMQEPRDEVVAVYRSCGFAVRDDLNVPEDHAGFELEFVALLCDRIADLKTAGEDAYGDLTVLRDFANAHLLSWLPLLQDRVDEYAEHRFYPALMRIIIGTIEEMRDEVETLLAMP